MKRPLHRRAFKAAFRVLPISLAVLVGVSSIWAIYSLYWIRQRHDAILRFELMSNDHLAPTRPSAPAGLWIFGEKGYSRLWYANRNEPAALPAINRIFPESKVYPHDPMYLKPPYNQLDVPPEKAD